MNAQDISIIIAAGSVAFVSVCTGMVTAGLQIAAFIRQGKSDVATVDDRKARDAAMADIKSHVNGMNKTIEKMAFKAGGDAERENPTPRNHAGS